LQPAFLTSGLMLIEHLIYSAKTHPWKLVSLILFLIVLAALTAYTIKREYSSSEDSSNAGPTLSDAAHPHFV
jgi:hypothetical membrane protein